MRKAILALGMIVFLGGLLAWQGAAIPPLTEQTSGDIPEASEQQVLATYGKLPLSFEANQGQTDPQVKFLSRGRGYSLFLTSTEAVLSLISPQDAPSAQRGNSASDSAPLVSSAVSSPQQESAVLRMRLVGANPDPHVVGLDELPGRSNYFIGNDPKKWRTDVPRYRKAKLQNVYPGIDLVYYGTNQRQLEYDFVVAPGADPGAIRLDFVGADKLTLDGEGNLILHLEAGEVMQRAPAIYQEASGARQEIAGGYVLEGRNKVGFEVATYDASKPLIIDPVLVYSTYLGGSGDDIAFRIAVDADGNAYVTGRTGSANFPTTVGTFQTTFGGSFDAFVAKLNQAGSALVYSTYLGGSGDDEAFGIAVDASGQAYVRGITLSTDFPTANAFQATFGGGSVDGFLAKLDANGSALVYSSFLGGSGEEANGGVAVDSLDNAYVAGSTASTDFPTTVGAFQTALGGGSFDATVTKVNADGSLSYSTYLGGSGEERGHGVAVDSLGNAYVIGTTASTDFPTTVGAFQTALGGGIDVYVVKFNQAGSALVYSTYLGGSVEDGAFGVAVDAAGNAYGTGFTTSTDFPTTVGAFQTAFGGGSFDAFVTKLNVSGAVLVFSTYLGGSGDEIAFGIAVDAFSNTYVTGQTGSTDFPTTVGAFQTALGGGNDAFVAKLRPPVIACVDPPSGLVSWWPGDGSGIDIAGDNDGTLEGGATFASGVVGQAFSFDGVDDFVDVPDSPSLDAISAAITVDAWINPQFPPIGAVWIFARRDPLVSEGFSVLLHSVGQVVVNLRTITSPSPSGSIFQSAPGVIQFQGQWQHIAVTADTTTGQVRAYVNGSPVPLTPVFGPGTISSELSNVNNLFIGRRQSSATIEGPVGGGHYEGLIDEVEVFNRALNGAEIAAIFEAGPLGKCNVEIDNKPGSKPNAINPTAGGLVPVAILTTDTFAATTVSPITVHFGPAGASPEHQLGHLEDVDGDGDLDLVLHFRTQETGIRCGDTVAPLTGQAFDGRPLRGADSIVTVGCS